MRNPVVKDGNQQFQDLYVILVHLYLMLAPWMQVPWSPKDWFSYIKKYFSFRKYFQWQKFVFTPENITDNISRGNIGLGEQWYSKDESQAPTRQVTGVRCAEIVARQLWAEYSSRPTTGAEQQCVRWLKCLIRKWSCVNLQSQFHTQIAYKPTYMTHDPCCMLLFIIGTGIKFNDTNSAIHSSGHSLGFIF